MKEEILEYFKDINHAYNDCTRFDTLKRMLGELQEPKTGRWIPVSERLPENRNQEVLISLEWGIDIGRYSNGEWYSEWINHYDDGNVLAWMPLPEPYKKEKEGEE